MSTTIAQDKANPPPQGLFNGLEGGAVKRVLRILVACEFSGIVRDAFLEKGHDTWSCDLLPAEHNSNRHIRGDVREILHDGWDLLIVAHPPCTRLCNSGVRWLHQPPPSKTIDQMWKDLRDGADLFSDLWNAPIPHICVENPVMHSHAKKLIRNYVEFSQSVQPWQFGHLETKRTCFWLKNLPHLRPTKIVEGRKPRVHRMPPSPHRWRERSRFFPGIAKGHGGPVGKTCALRRRQTDEAPMTVSCSACGQEWPCDPALEVECPTCHMAVGVKCPRPSGHGCNIHAPRHQIAMDKGFLERCPAVPRPEAPYALPRFANCQPPVPLLEKGTTHDGDYP